ncbi:MAG: hypothetical protein KGQ49_00160 [Verrucomicrobia bacterium]|nr:hypothetical protein [Verrucomicrobiota bacterium]MBU6445792.1 hypothetical protein [Verrucomicrobiota bacterium]MDE3047424.1 hypothetical protein [Verrucomicrobiota bacterium]
MELSNTLHRLMQPFDLFETLSDQVDLVFREHPTVFKVALVVNHLFRSLAMSFMLLSPVCWPICFVGSVFYRITVEKNCAFKFTIPSLAGGISLLLAQSGFSMAPLGLYLSYVVLTVDYEVDHRPCGHCMNVSRSP